VLALELVMEVAGDDKISMHQRLPFGGHDKRSLKRCLKALEKFKAFVLWLRYVHPVVRSRAFNRRS